jgi:hypothetical protein
MIDNMNDQFLTQLVDEPTTGSNILDLIFSSNPAQVYNIQVIPGIRDHSAVKATFNGKFKVNKKPARAIYMYKKDVLKSLSEVKC